MENEHFVVVDPRQVRWGLPLRATNGRKIVGKLGERAAACIGIDFSRAYGCYLRYVCIQLFLLLWGIVQLGMKATRYLGVATVIVRHPYGRQPGTD